MTLNNDDLNKMIDERIALRLEAEQIVNIFTTMNERQKEELAQALSRFMWDRQQALRKPNTPYTIRWIKDGANVDETEDGTGVGHAGPTLPRIIEQHGGAAWLDSRSTGEHLHFTGAGGADCMFHYLVSECYADLVSAGTHAEGQVFQAVSGCLYKIFSTVQGAVTDAETNNELGNLAAFTGTNRGVIWICPGQYAEDVTVYQDACLFLYGSGRTATIIGDTDNASDLSWVFNLDPAGGSNSSIDIIFRNLTIQSNTSAAAASGGILTGAQNRIVVEDCDLQGGSTSADGWVINNTSTANIDLSVRRCRVYSFNGFGTSGAYGIRVGDQTANANTDIEISDCTFHDCAVGLGVSSYAKVMNCVFDSCTIGIELGTSLGTWDNIYIDNCVFDGGSTGIALIASANQGRTVTITNNQAGRGSTAPSIFFDFSGASATETQDNYGWTICNNYYEGANGGIFLKGPATITLSSTNNIPFAGMLVQFNTVVTTGGNDTNTVTFYSGDTEIKHPFNIWSGNRTDTGALSTGVGSNSPPTFEPLDGMLGRLFTAGVLFLERIRPLTVGVTPHIVRFGTQAAVSVTRQTAELTASATNYGYLNTSGTLTNNTTGFPTTAHIPLWQIACGVSLSQAIYSSHTDVAGIMYAADATTIGGTFTPSEHDFVGTAHAHDTDYTQTPNVDGIGVGGGDIDVYSDNGSTQTGEWDSTTGHIGIRTTADTAIQLKTEGTYTDPVALTGVSIRPTINRSSSALTEFASIIAPTVNLTAAFTYAGELHALKTGYTLDDGGNSGTFASAAAWSPLMGLLSGTVTSMKMIHVHDATVVGGTIDTLYGIDIEALAAASTNVGMRNQGTSRLVGQVTVGADAAATSGMELEVVGQTYINGTLIFDGESAPSTPSSDDIVVYNETGTDKLKLKDDNGEVYLLNSVRRVGLTVESPANADDVTIFCIPATGTIETVRAVLVGTSTPSVQWNLYKASDRSAAGTAVWSSDKTTTSTTTGDTFTTFDSATLTGDEWLWFQVNAAIGGTVTNINVTVSYRET